VRANREGHTIGLFTKAIEQLASEDPSVRHGGVYALELLADLDPGYKGHAQLRTSGLTGVGVPQ
jgi:hypothetical protein